MSIFVQIASYRDPELVPTIEDLLRKSKFPEKLSFGICHQYHPDDGFDNLDRYRKDTRFRIIDVPYQDSRGVCWARNCIQQLYQGETYTLQIDSHARFATYWDEQLVKMICSLQQNGFDKPVLTGYPAAYDPANDPQYKTNTPALQMVLSHFTQQGIPMYVSEPIPGADQLTDPVPARSYAAGFAFTLGSFCVEVKHDPELYFIGEEVSITVRAFTNGYDLFHPHKMLAWHQYIRSASAKHWDDDGNWQHKNQRSLKKTRILLGIEPAEGTDDYTIGSIRTLASYEIYAGIDFANSGAQTETLKKTYPSLDPSKPKDKAWCAGIKKYYELETEIALKLLQTDPEILLTVLDIGINTIYENKINSSELPVVPGSSSKKIKACFFSDRQPVTWMARLTGDSNGSTQIIRGRIPFDEKRNSLFKCNL